MFPCNRLDEITSNPSHFKLLELMPLAKDMHCYDMQLVGDEVNVIITDVETTGYSSEKDKMIELGAVKCLFSPSKKQITKVVSALSQLEAPGFALPEEIINVTGITDEVLDGHSFDDEQVNEFFSGDPIVIAHNAKFDRGFIEKRFDNLKNLRWGCSIKDVNWSQLGFEGNKLEYLNLKLGYFYEGHRATVDCLAVLQLLFSVPPAQKELFDSIERDNYVLRAYGAPFELKDTLKANGYKWNPGEGRLTKHWYKSVANDIDEEWASLLKLYPRASVAAEKQVFTARERYCEV